MRCLKYSSCSSISSKNWVPGSSMKRNSSWGLEPSEKPTQMIFWSPVGLAMQLITRNFFNQSRSRSGSPDSSAYTVLNNGGRDHRQGPPTYATFETAHYRMFPFINTFFDVLRKSAAVVVQYSIFHWHIVECGIDIAAALIHEAFQTSQRQLAKSIAFS